jgi:hypothetical protein
MKFACFSVEQKGIVQFVRLLKCTLVQHLDQSCGPAGRSNKRLKFQTGLVLHLTPAELHSEVSFHRVREEYDWA